MYPFPPDGYWYVIAYEGVQAAPSTWGAGNTSIAWRKYDYPPQGKITGVDAQGLVLNAQIQHQATDPMRGAIRAYWWNGTSWVLQSDMNKDWGSLGLSSDATQQPQLPSSLPAPAASIAQQGPPSPSGAGGGTLLLWSLVIAIPTAMVWWIAKKDQR